MFIDNDMNCKPCRLGMEENCMIDNALVIYVVKCLLKRDGIDR